MKKKKLSKMSWRASKKRKKKRIQGLRTMMIIMMRITQDLDLWIKYKNKMQIFSHKYNKRK